MARDEGGSTRGVPSIRAVLFDAVGTLIRPEPSAADAYAVAGARHGVALPRDEVASRFRHAFGRQEALDQNERQGRTDEARERQRWRNIVADVFVELDDSSALFDELWQHFARSTSWQLCDGAEAALSAVAGRGWRIGIASNFDARLQGVWTGLAHAYAEVPLFISSLVGWRKPHREFFAAIERDLELAPAELLLVGDDRVNDFEAAQAAGWRSVLVDAAVNNRPSDAISTLADLPRWIEATASVSVTVD